MHQLPEDPSFLQCIDECLPLAGSHLITCIIYIPIILSFNYRYRKHRRPFVNHEDFAATKWPVEIFILCLYMVVLQVQQITYRFNGRHETGSFWFGVLKPTSLSIILGSALYCFIEDKTFDTYINQPYKVMLPGLPAWDKIRQTKKDDTVALTGANMRITTVTEQYVMVKDQLKARVEPAWLWMTPDAHRPLPLQTPICFFTRQQMRAFSYAKLSAGALTMSALSTCHKGVISWLTDTHARPGYFDLHSSYFYAWLFATFIFLGQTMRILKRGEVGAARDGLPGFKKLDSTKE